VEEKLSDLARFARKLGYAAPVGLLNRSQPLFESSSCFFPFRSNCCIPSCAAALAAVEKTFLSKPLNSCDGRISVCWCLSSSRFALGAKLALLGFARSIGLRSNEASHKDSTIIHIKAVLCEKDVLTKQTNQSQIKIGYVQ
jgi:hypothetical protein